MIIEKKLEEIIVKTHTPIPDDDLEILQIYSEKVEEFYQNILESKISFNGGFSVQRDKNGKVSGSVLNLSNNQLKSLLLDYRFFHANDEPINFFTIKNLIGKYHTSPQMNMLLKSEKKQWQDSGFFFKFSGIKQNDLIDTLINTQYFHVGKKFQRLKAKAIKEEITSEMEILLIASAIHDRSRVLRNIKWVIEPLIKRKGYIRLPKQSIIDLEVEESEKLEKYRIQALKEEKVRLFEVAKNQQKIFNATKFFDENIVAKVCEMHLGWGANAKIVSQKIPELDITDAQGIINNISNKFVGK